MSSEQSKSQAKRVAIEQGRSVHSKPAIPMQVRPDVSKESEDAIVEHLRTVREDHAADLIEQLQARNAELEASKPLFSYRHFKAKAEAAQTKLTALLDGIEGLEKEWRRVTDPYTKGIVGRCADYLRALREKANG